MNGKVLRVILWDQLTHNISSLKDINPGHDLIFMCESKDEATHVKHHKKKLVFLFSAMRHFRAELTQKGFQVIYIDYDHPENSHNLFEEIKKAALKNHVDKIIITHPSEYHLMEKVVSLKGQISIDIEIREDDRFLCSIDEFKNWANGKKSLRMEYFYRSMRLRTGYLMNGADPIGGSWNYDEQNRLPLTQIIDIPKPYKREPDETTIAVMKMVENHFDDHFGDIDPFFYGVNHNDAWDAFKQFVAQRLSNFGPYQDAMVENDPWLFHSHISLYLNAGLLTAKDCLDYVEQAFHELNLPLNSVEGFIRQILGWREYVRGIYWLLMPQYRYENALNATRNLPWFYWSGAPKMNCIKACVSDTKKFAYANHIQRLMVLGNFALLTGIDPLQVNNWYWVVYADAFEWVELPNVSGMVLFADSGYLASKPYAASGAYINKMSNYCKNCHYKVSVKNGPNACPFNYLYWNFLIKNHPVLKNNHRLGMIYKTLEKMDPIKRKMIQTDASNFLDSIENA